MTKTSFSQLLLSEAVLSAVTEMGFDEATDVQAESIPLIRTGADVLARSQTGTGKTVAFGIPAVEHIEAENAHVQVLILSPTRELAHQCGDEIRKLSKNLPYVKTADILGGSDYREQFRKLRDANLVIGTPGRIMDHMKRGSLQLNHLKMIILDEADEMLNMGFREDIEVILKDAPEQRQTVLFSATVPPEILSIAKRFQRDPQRVEINRNQITLENIKQLFVNVPPHSKIDAMSHLLHFYAPHRAIIFTNTKSMVDELTEKLGAEGFSAAGIHGDMKQTQRSTVMNGFKHGRISILVATDVAARGIDVSDVDYVFNYDIPQETDYYVHRIGRTGRAGRTGTALTLCCGRRQLSDFQRLAYRTKSKATQIPFPTVGNIESAVHERQLAKAEKALQNEPLPVHAEMVEKLIEKGYSPEKIASILLGLVFRQPKKSFVEIPGAGVLSEASAPTQEKGGSSGNRQSMVDLILDIGSSKGIRTNHIVGAITEQAKITSKCLGKIKINETCSLVSVPANQAEEIVHALKAFTVCGKPVHVSALAETSGRRRPSSQKSYPKKDGGRGRDNGKRYASRRHSD